MEETFTMDILHTKLLTEIKNKGKARDIAIFFNSRNSIDDMFKYFYNLEEAHLILNTPTIPLKGKSEEQANELRSEGNLYYQKFVLDQALTLYNKSIMAAPHPNIVYHHSNEEASTTGDGEYKCLALGFANRSAVLFELEQYDKCISDIDLAVKYGYPNAQHHKLTERKAKCLLALKCKKEAESLIQVTMAELSDQEIDKTKINQIKKQFDKLLDKCQQGSIFEIKSNKYTSGNLGENVSLHFDKPILPTLDTLNSRTPCFSDELKLAYEPSRGRFIVAERDITPGTLLSVECAYSSFLLLSSENLRSRCSNCFIKCDYLLPCPTCSLVVFCSESCRESAMKGFHKVECSMLSTLYALKLDDHTAMLGYRCITQMPFQDFKKKIKLLRGNAENTCPKMSGFNESGTYDSNDLRTVFSLVDNIDQVVIGDLFKKCSIALVLTKLLLENKEYFPCEFGKIIKPDEEDILLIGSTIMRLTSNFDCNSYDIGKLEKSTNAEAPGTGIAIGSGVFPAHSLQNHSCNPTTVHCTLGNSMITYATRFIPAGSEVTVSYGFHYALDGLTDRRTALREQFYFDCICDACVGEWQMYHDLTVNTHFVSASKYDEDSSDHNTIKDDEDIKHEFRVLRQKFQKAYQNISQSVSTESDIQSIILIIEFMSKHIEQPNRMFYGVQESLKRGLGIPCSDLITS